MIAYVFKNLLLGGKIFDATPPWSGHESDHGYDIRSLPNHLNVFRHDIFRTAEDVMT